MNDEEFERVGRVKYEQIKNYGIGIIDTRLKCKDGRLIDVHLSSAPVNPEDLSQGVVFTAMDITEQKRAEKALKASEARLSNMIEHSADGIVMVDGNGIVRFVNPAAEFILDRRANELRGQLFDFPLAGEGSTDIQVVSRRGESRVVEMRVIKTEWEDQAYQSGGG